MKNLMAVLSLVASAAVVAAGEWVHIGTDQSGVSYAYNLAKIKFESGRTVRLWTESRGTKPRVSSRGKRYTRLLMQVAISCQDEAISYGQAIYYSASGESVDSDNSWSSPMVAAPGSIGDELVSRVCADSRAQ